MEDFKDFIEGNKNFMTEFQSKDHNVLVFAFVGDAVFSLFVRTYLADISTAKAGILHTKTTQFVRAKYQSEQLDVLEPLLTDDEKEIVNTARNTKTNNIAKHSNIEEYKKSTSFEALLGFLYLTHQNKRLLEILEFTRQNMEKDI